MNEITEQEQNGIEIPIIFIFNEVENKYSQSTQLSLEDANMLFILADQDIN